MSLFDLRKFLSSFESSAQLRLFEFLRCLALFTPSSQAVPNVLSASRSNQRFCAGCIGESAVGRVSKSTPNSIPKITTRFRDLAGSPTPGSSWLWTYFRHPLDLPGRQVLNEPFPVNLIPMSSGVVYGDRFIAHVRTMYGVQSHSRPLSYAPTPYGYTPNQSLTARINLDEEVKLADSAAERDLIDSLVEIYSIIRTLDGLEKAYIKDALPEIEYSEMCSKLLKQYRSILTDETISREFGDLDMFCRNWNVGVPVLILL